nr:hypothetical protein [Tanacetum cinerariifolium]
MSKPSFCYYDAFLASVEPKTYKEALTQACWIEAMQEELYEFERLEVWELVPRPDKVMVITLKWIYKVKLDELGGILKNKARQPDGFVDAGNPNHVYKLKKALYGLKQAPRACQPDGFVDTDNPNHVYKLKKALYGLKQAPHEWQKSATISSTKAKYIALSGYYAQVLWMRSQLTDYRLGINKIPIFHFIKEQVKNEVAELYFVNTEYQLADIFTKALGRERIGFFINKLRMQIFMPETLKQLVDKAEE